MEIFRNRKSFLMGFAAGILLMVVGVISFGLLDRQMRWGGNISPNNKITEIFTLLESYSIIPFEREILLQNMYRGLLDGVGDPYTHYFDPVALEAFHIRTEGMFVGIGVLVMMDPVDRTVTIATAYEGAPAAQAGLMPGDRIVNIDGRDVVGRSLEEVTNLIKGPEGSTVGVTVLRPGTGERINVDIVRTQVSIPTVFHEMLPEGTGYIRIEGFDKVTTEQFVEAMQNLRRENMHSLIIDLRNNPGGLLDVVVDIANVFLPPGIITYTEDVNGSRRYFKADENYINIPLVVLVNGRSASASEVFAGAVQDTGVGTIVGETTFGKGIVQNIFGLTDGSAVKMTVAKYFTPNGTSIHGTGLLPDVVVEMDEHLGMRIGRISIEEDVQLQTALGLVQAIVRD